MEQVNKSQSLKVLWWSNGLHVGTGYGVQTNNVVSRLHDLGYNIRVASNFGQQGAALDYNGIKQYGTSGLSEFGEDDLKCVVDNWKPHVLITLYDIWLSAYSKTLGPDWLSRLHNRWVAWLPVDSDPIAQPVADQAAKAYKAIAMSKFGQTQLIKADVKAEYIPHGVDTQIFKPSTNKQTDKAWLEKHSSPINPANRAVINPTDFVIGINKANKDRERADYGCMLTAFKLFLDANPEARQNTKLFMHTWVDFPGATPIRLLCKELGIEQNVKVTHEYYMRCGLNSNDMAKMYGGFDVLLNLARGEGFGVPIIEAEACGVPVVATDYTAMTELVKGHGWLIPPFACEYHGGVKLRNGLNSLWALPDEYKAADALTEAYLHPKTVSRYGKLSQIFAQDYDFSTKILPMWQNLLGEVESELGMFGTAQTKDDAFSKLFAEATK